MPFSYSRYKKQEEHGSQWTSYSDLFMGLSFVFLLLYVTSSLRTGATGIQQQIKVQQAALENDELKSQLKVYESLKKDYLESEATPDEEKAYAELMGKLNLLQDAAKKEKDDLTAAARENAEKEEALNKYQQMVKSIINANMVAKSRIKKRNTIIEEQDESLVQKTTEISQLEKTVNAKKQEIAVREQKIQEMNSSLDKRLKQLRSAYKNQQLTKKKYDSQISQIQNDYSGKINDLKTQNSKAYQQINSVSAQLAGTQAQLQTKEGMLAAKEKEAQGLKGQLAGAEKAYADKAALLRGEFEAQRLRDKAAFDGEMQKQQYSAAERAGKEAAYRASVAQKEQELGRKIAGLQGQLGDTEAQLAKARAEVEARKLVANEIKKGFAKAGIKAEVDGESGDVTIDFGEHYFDTGQANVKNEMAQILQKAMPIYSKALMSNSKVANKINAVEIVGYASPTYQGRFINPNSLDPADKKAVEYNLDLSYQRAKSIFQYAFNQDKMKFEYQKQLRPLVKVSGKSFFDSAKVSRDIASQDAKTFCQNNDCKKSQRVLIKFTVDSK